ncbi:unnamed protein product [Ranitomeya imitator]|uniref:Uncharacterized protein n=1 Tax=Ranitomeya imitator TaxID=111125 RepID=A0ABN9LKG3_9NEOB|nr:unnamed protein product [Ranitomeya imitator]
MAFCFIRFSPGPGKILKRSHETATPSQVIAARHYREREQREEREGCRGRWKLWRTEGLDVSDTVLQIPFTYIGSPPDRRFSELSDYRRRRLAQKLQDSFRRLPPKAQMDFLHTAETQSDYTQYAACNDYLRAAQAPSFSMTHVTASLGSCLTSV